MNKKKWQVVLMRCMACGNVNRSDEIGCIFGCRLGRLNIEYSSYRGVRKPKS